MRVSVIVPTINGLRLLRECLPGLEAQTYRDVEIIVVDDGGSTDGTIEYIRKSHPRVVLVELPRNRGYAGACNAGLDVAQGELVGVLGNDNAPEPTWLEQLVRALDENPDAAAVTSLSLHADDSGPRPVGSLHMLGYYRRLSLDWPLGQSPAPAFCPSGNALLCRRSVVERFYDELYCMYAEDVSLGWRLRLKGWQILQVLTSVTHHGGSATTSRKPARKAFFETRNRVLNLLTHFDRSTLARLVPLIAGDAVLTLLRGQRWARLQALLWLASRWPLVLRKRRVIQRSRRVPDRALLPYFAPPGRLLRPYFALVGLGRAGAAFPANGEA